MKLGSISVGSMHPPFIIAEMSGNHHGRLEQALKLVDEIAAAGAHALKLQTYRPDSLTIKSQLSDFLISNPKSLWNGRTLYELYEEAATPYEWHEALFARCKEKGILCFSTPFDEEGVDFLESLHTPFYKIASFENSHIPLLKKVAKTRKPIILSTGMATLEELAHSVQILREEGCDQLVLLKCTSSYPASPSQTNLRTIPHMSALFQCEVGLSDHTLGIGVALGSIAFGATVIEKHVTLNRGEGGVDAAFSLEPQELKQLVEESQRLFLAGGHIFYGPTEEEISSLQFRRSIYITKDLQPGEQLTIETMKIIRPGYGLAPRYYESLIGRKIKREKKAGEPLQWEDL